MKSTLRPTPRLSRWKTIPPGECRLGRDIHGLSPRYPSFVNLVAVTFSGLTFSGFKISQFCQFGGCHLFWPWWLSLFLACHLFWPGSGIWSSTRARATPRPRHAGNHSGESRCLPPTADDPMPSASARKLLPSCRQSRSDNESALPWHRDGAFCSDSRVESTALTLLITGDRSCA